MWWYHLSVRMLTDASANTVDQLSQFPYGETLPETGPATTPWKFTTYNRDSESNNDYAIAREYVNRFGRFNSVDPSGLGVESAANPQSWNLYGYVLSAPVDLTDPTGLDSGGGGGGGSCFLGVCAPVAPLPSSGDDSSPYYKTPTTFPQLGIGTGFYWLDLILGPPPPYVKIIFDYHHDQYGYGVGNEDGEPARMCTADGACQTVWWDAESQSWNNLCEGPCISGRAHDTLGKAGDLADKNLKLSVETMAVIDSLVVTAVDISAVESGQLFGTRFAGNRPLLNSLDSLRIGWSQVGEDEYVFRIGGDWVPDAINGGHINLWPPSWWFGKP